MIMMVHGDDDVITLLLGCFRIVTLGGEIQRNNYVQFFKFKLLITPYNPPT